MPLLSKEQFQAGARVRVKAVAVPELGEVCIRSLPSVERDAWEGSILGGGGVARDVRNLRARLVSRALCEPDGTPWFADDQAAEGHRVVGGLDSFVIDYLFEACHKHSRMSKEDVDEVEKKFAPAQSENFGTA